MKIRISRTLLHSSDHNARLIALLRIMPMGEVAKAVRSIISTAIRMDDVETLSDLRQQLGDVQVAIDAKLVALGRDAA